MKDKVIWALEFNLEGCKYGFTTSNMAEVFNKVLKGIRSLPVTTIVAYSFHKCDEYFVNRHQEAQVLLQDQQRWGPIVKAKIEDAQRRAHGQ